MTGVSNCVQCRAEAPHSLHVQVSAENVVTFIDNSGNLVQPPSTINHFCPLCHKEVSFIDPEFGNAFCLECQWMGEVEVAPEPECICGIDDDPSGKLPRLDIVCPKHD